MNKQELVKKIAEDTEMTQKDAAAVLESALAWIEKTVASGEKVQLVGFGTFERKKREARLSRNPRTGEEVQIQAAFFPTFKAGKGFREEVR